MKKAQKTPRIMAVHEALQTVSEEMSARKIIRSDRLLNVIDLAGNCTVSHGKCGKN